MTSRLVFAVAACAVLAGTTGCTLLWVFNQDPEHLPCHFEDDQPQGVCLDGYTCVGGECIKAGQKPEGEPCARTEECQDGLGCAIGSYRFCNDGGDDINCPNVANEEKELRCRPICDTTQDCDTDKRCFTIDGVKGVPGVCQPGTCSGDSDCSTADDDQGAWCVDFTNGKSGLCIEACDPLQCAVAGEGNCNGCDGLDDDRDPGFNCTAVVGRNLNGDAMCDAIGTTPPFAPCGGPGQDLCGYGATCIADGVGVLCRPWCSTLEEGNPKCPVDHPNCIEVRGAIGYCQ